MVQTKSCFYQRFHSCPMMHYHPEILLADGTPSKSVTPCICLMGHADRRGFMSGGRVETGAGGENFAGKTAYHYFHLELRSILRDHVPNTRWGKKSFSCGLLATKIKVTNHFPLSSHPFSCPQRLKLVQRFGCIMA